MKREDKREIHGKSIGEWRKEIREVLLRSRKYRDMDYSAAKLAATVGLRPCALSLVVKETFGVAYSDLVNSARVEDAKKMLGDRRKDCYTVDEIGLMVGFANRQSFFSAFMKFTGTTPQKYRVGATLD